MTFLRCRGAVVLAATAMSLLAAPLLAGPAEDACTLPVASGALPIHVEARPEGRAPFTVRVTAGAVQAHLQADRLDVDGALRFSGGGARAQDWRLASPFIDPGGVVRLGPHEGVGLDVVGGVLVGTFRSREVLIGPLPVPCASLTLEPIGRRFVAEDRFSEELARVDGTEWMPRGDTIAVCATPEDDAYCIPVGARNAAHLRLGRTEVRGDWVRVVGFGGSAAFAGWTRAAALLPYAPPVGSGGGLGRREGDCKLLEGAAAFDGEATVQAGTAVYDGPAGGRWATTTRPLRTRVRWRATGASAEWVQLAKVPGILEPVPGRIGRKRAACDELSRVWVPLAAVAIPDKEGRRARAQAALPKTGGQGAVAAARAALGLDATGRLAVSEHHACAVQPDGAVLCWGQGERGALGDGSLANTDEAVRVVDLPPASQVAVGAGWSAAITRDGAVYAWGKPTKRGPVTRTPTRLAGAGDSGRVIALSGAGYRLFVLYADGHVRVRERHGGVDRLVPVEGLVNAIALAVGSEHACALLRGGDVLCWGENRAGQLGLGDRRAREIPTGIPGLREVRRLAVGEKHTCAVRRGGEVLCWGSNHRGELVPDGETALLTPTVTPLLTDVVDLAAGSYATLALGRDGRVRCISRSSYGDGLEGGTSIDPGEVVQVKDLAGVTELVAMGDRACARAAGGVVHCWGARRAYGSAPIPGLTDARLIRVGGDTTCALRETGAFRCWGERGFGRRLAPDPDARDFDVSGSTRCRVSGDGTVVSDERRPTLAKASGVTRVAIAPSLRCVVADDRLHCKTNVGGRYAFRYQSMKNPAGLGEVVDVAVMGRRWCAVEKSGRVACGTGPEEETAAPPSAPDFLPDVDDAVAVATGLRTTCVRRDSGALACFVEGRPRPVPGMEDVTVVSVDVTETRLCAALEDGRVLCAIRKSIMSGYSPARPVPGVTTAVQVAVGRHHACARLADGTVRCWGNAERGRVDGVRGPLPIAGTAAVGD